MTDSDDVCVICLGEADNRSTTDKCDHLFCYSCIHKWCKVKTTCPLCRQQFSLIIHDKKDIRAYNITFAGIEEAASEIDVNQLNAEINDRIRFVSTLITNGEGIIYDYHRLLIGIWTFFHDVNVIKIAKSNISCYPYDFLLQNVGNIALEIEQRVRDLEIAVNLWKEYRSIFEEASLDLESYLNNSSELAFMSRHDALAIIEDVVDYVSESRHGYIRFKSVAEMFLSDERTFYEDTQSKINTKEHTFRQMHPFIAKIGYCNKQHL